MGSSPRRGPVIIKSGPPATTWRATRRYVSSQFEMFYSATRTPSTRWEKGYAERRHVAIPRLSMVNLSPFPTRFNVTIWNMTGSVNPEMSLVGSLPTYRGDIFKIGDNPRIKWESFKTGQKAGDIFTSWQGFVEIFASDDIYPKGWIDYSRKAAEEAFEHDWSRPMAFDVVTEMRQELVWPIVDTTATEQFRAAPGAAATSDFIKLITGAAASVDDFLEKN